MQMPLRNVLFRTGLYDWSLRGRTPERLRGIPVDPEVGSVEEGRAVLDGDYPLFGKVQHLGDLPWKNTGLTPQERIILHRFSFLRGLQALGSDDAADKGRELMTRWINQYGRWKPDAWEPAITGGRLTNWLCTYGFLKNPEHPGFEMTLLDSASAQLRHLSRTIEESAPGSETIEAAEGLILGSLCLVGMETLIDAGMAAMEIAIQRQILADGGHYQRNPSIQLDVLNRLIRIRDTLAAAQVAEPHWLDHAIGRMASMLKALCHSDGRLSLFNGSTEGDRDRINHTIKAIGDKVTPLWSAPHSGFQRIEAKGAVVIADAGAATISGSSQDAHAGLLSFEFSRKKHRIIVNCGAHGDRSNEWSAMLRNTAAHSTLTVDDTNAIEVDAKGGLNRLPAEISCRRSESDGSTFIQMTHSGYRPVFGLTHGRDLYLSANGDDLRGRDVLTLSPDHMGRHAKRFCIRFHLHPDVKGELAGGGDSVLLKVPEREGWRFRMFGGEIALEESIYLGVPGLIRRTKQITISGDVNPHATEIKWSLIMEGAKK